MHTIYFSGHICIISSRRQSLKVELSLNLSLIIMDGITNQVSKCFSYTVEILTYSRHILYIMVK